MPVQVNGPEFGLTYNMAVAQGAANDSANIVDFGANATIGATIYRTDAQIAGEMIHVEVDSFSGFVLTPQADITLYKPQLNEIEFKIVLDGEDPNDTDLVNPVNCVDRNRCVQYGPVAAFVCRTAGQKKIRIWAREIGTDRRAYWEQSFTVGDADSYFAGHQVYISDNGGDTLAGTLATYTDIASAMTARSGFQRTRFIFKNGVTTTLGENQIDLDVFGATCWHFTLEDVAGAQHTLDRSGQPSGGAGLLFFNGNGADATKEIYFRGIRMRSDWDVTTETGEHAHIGWGARTTNIGFHKFTLDQCTGENLSIPFSNQGLSTGDERIGMCVHDCVGKNMRDAGFFSGQGGGLNLIVGCYIYRDDDASYGGGKATTIADDRSNVHGPIRLSAPLQRHITLITKCCLYGHSGWTKRSPQGGWFTEGVEPEPSGGFQQQQAGWRVNTNQVPGSVANIQQNYAFGGIEVCHLSFQGGQYPSPHENMIVQRNWLVTYWGSTRAAVISNGGLKFTHNVILSLDQKKLFGAAGGVRAALQMEDIVASPTNGTADPTVYGNQVRVEFNTFVSLTRDSDDQTGDADYPMVYDETIAQNGGTSLYTDFIEGNNVRIMQNVATPVTADGPLSLEVLHAQDFGMIGYFHTSGTSAPYDRVRWPATGSDPFFANPSGQGMRCQPLQGAGALNAATNGWRTWDIVGNDHRGTHKGAWGGAYREAS